MVEWEHGDCRRCVSGDPAALGGTDSCSLIIVIMQHAAVYLCGYDKPPKNNIDIQYNRFFLLCPLTNEGVSQHKGTDIDRMFHVLTISSIVGRAEEKMKVRQQVF